MDKSLACRDCGAPFTFTAGEQEFYAQKGFTNEPGRCPECRAARKNRARRDGLRQRPRLRRGGPRLPARAAPDVLGRLLAVRRDGAGTLPAARRQARLLLELLRATAELSLADGKEAATPLLYGPPHHGGGPRTRTNDGQIDTLAQQLASQHASDELQRLLAERTALLEETNRDGTNSPARVAWRATMPPARPGRSPRAPSSLAAPSASSPTTTNSLTEPDIRGVSLWLTPRIV